MSRALPPFRADQVGSLLRPEYLKRARAEQAAGKISSEQLKTVEDQAIQEVIAREEAIGLRGITDGEFRRSLWHLDFLEHIGGCEAYQAEQGLAFKGGVWKAKGLKVARTV